VNLNLYHDIIFHMIQQKSARIEALNPSLRERNRRVARDIVLDAAERLLARDIAGDFSMRALATEAGVGFATPFNHFGSKNAIMRALSARVIERMAEQFRANTPRGDAIQRVLALARISVTLLTSQSTVYRTVVGSLGSAASGHAGIHDHSRALWQLALNPFDGMPKAMRRTAEGLLAEQLAYVFRGCLSFWIAGDIADEDLDRKVQTGMSVVLLGFAGRTRRQELMRVIGR
jgi:AcrR family transcriptional regulator